MADADRLSILPVIKCSSCGASIEISQLADHVCATAPSNAPAPTSPKLDRSATFGGASFNRSDSQPRSGRMHPPARIDPYAANKPFRALDPSPMSNYGDPNSRSPLSPGNGRPPFPMNRSATSPMPRSLAPPSPELPPNMDCAFPPFPMGRNGTPTSAKSKSRNRPEPKHNQQHMQSSARYAPLSPRTDGGESVVKRMNTIAPGPFDGRSSESRPSTSHGQASPARSRQQSGHRRNNTQGSMRSNGMAPNQRTSLASTASRSSIFSNGSSGLPARPKLGMGPGGANSAPPLPPAPQEQSEGIDAFLRRLQQETMEPSRIGQDSRSKTFPVRQESMDTIEPQQSSEGDRPPRRATEIESSGFVPRSNNLFPSRSISRAGAKTSLPRDDLPPLPPVPNYARDFPADPLHTPSDSGLSEDSYTSSGFRSAASSRSSPPASEAAHSRQASKIVRTNYMSDDPIERTTSPESYTDAKPAPLEPANRRENSGLNRARVPEPLLQPPKAPFHDPPESPLDPAIQIGLLKGSSGFIPLRDPALISPLPRADSEPQRTMDRRPATANKGKCRGCSEPIVGKSVKDSSGRLTGRYHKLCFVCRTCQDPFPTAEFYVFNNFPYCEHHYHELNGSLCQSCNRGIEGQYLETDSRQKFHPRCFTCSTCRVVLRDDYYEVDARNYCERHAYAAMNKQNKLLGPGVNSSRNLQKRRTRIMMMS